MAQAPPTEPGELGIADPGETPTDARVRKLEKKLRLIWLSLMCSVILILALGGTTLLLTFEHAKQIAAQKAEEQMQLELLRNLQSDFDNFDTQIPTNKLQAYGELQRTLQQLQGFYGSMGEFDLADPEASLDRLLGEPQRRPGGDRGSND